MADQLADAFLQSVFKTRELAQNNRQFQQELNFHQMQLAAENQRAQATLEAQKQYQQGILANNEAELKQRQQQYEQTQNQQNAQFAFGMQTQGLARPVEPAIAQQNQQLGPLPPGVQAPPAATKFGQQYLQPISVVDRLKEEEAAKAKIHQEAFVSSIKSVNDALDLSASLSGQPVDPKDRAQILQIHALAAQGVPASAMETILGRKFNFENFVTGLMEKPMEEFKKKADADPAFFASPTGQQAFKTLIQPIMTMKALSANASGQNIAYKETVRTSQAESKAVLAQALSDAKFDSNSPNAATEYSAIVQSARQALAKQGRILDPDAEKEFEQSVLKIQPVLRPTDAMINKMLGGGQQQSPPGTPGGGNPIMGPPVTIDNRKR